VIVRFGSPVPLADLREPGRAKPSHAALETATERIAAAIRALISTG
jgi:hypothetical protein